MPGPAGGRAAVLVFLLRWFSSLLSLYFLRCAVIFLFKADCAFKTEPYSVGVCQGLLTGDARASLT